MVGGWLIVCWQNVHLSQTVWILYNLGRASCLVRQWLRIKWRLWFLHTIFKKALTVGELRCYSGCMTEWLGDPLIRHPWAFPRQRFKFFDSYDELPPRSTFKSFWFVPWLSRYIIKTRGYQSTRLSPRTSEALLFSSFWVRVWEHNLWSKPFSHIFFGCFLSRSQVSL